MLRLRLLPVLLAAALPLLPASASGELVRFRLLPQESKVSTRIIDPFGKIVVGELALREGEAQGDTSNLKGTGSVRIVLEADSYNSNLGLRDNDVKTYYLEAKEHPLVIFTGSVIDVLGDPQSPHDSWSLAIKGALELHGTKKEVRVPVKLTNEGKRLIAEGTFKIWLRDFNIAVPTLIFYLRSADQVEVSFHIVGERQP